MMNYKGNMIILVKSLYKCSSPLREVKIERIVQIQKNAILITRVIYSVPFLEKAVGENKSLLLSLPLLTVERIR